MQRTLVVFRPERAGSMVEMSAFSSLPMSQFQVEAACSVVLILERPISGIFPRARRHVT